MIVFSCYYSNDQSNWIISNYRNEYYPIVDFTFLHETFDYQPGYVFLYIFIFMKEDPSTRQRFSFIWKIYQTSSLILDEWIVFFLDCRPARMCSSKSLNMVTIFNLRLKFEEIFCFSSWSISFSFLRNNCRMNNEFLVLKLCLVWS